MASEKLANFANAAAIAAVNLSRPNYFDNSKRGELFDLQSELNSDLEIVRKEAVKKVIAAMTLGNDVSPLFPDVLKNIQTEDLELKKLVYLYLMNYSKSQPELVVLAINTFCKDSSHENPQIRALAIRTMGCMRVEKVFDYLLDPLTLAINDPDPYVRKTAVICIAKAAMICIEIVDDNGFIDLLQDALNDKDPSVVSNSISALYDIQEQYPDVNALLIDQEMIKKLCQIINECTEWGQVTILDAISKYKPVSNDEIEQISASVIPRLSHSNSSVVMSAIKVLTVISEYANIELLEKIQKKLAPPLVSLLSCSSPLQYAALRNINLIIQKYPCILSGAVRVFFCKFNDPLYVKLEKLEIIHLLVSEDNAEYVLSELLDYCHDVDLEFSSISIRKLSNVAIKICSLEESVFKALRLLVDNSGKIQFTSLSLQSLLRHFPENRTGLECLQKIFDDFDGFDDKDCRSAVVWLLGEYGEMFDQSCQNILQNFIENVEIEDFSVQGALLTTGLKLYIRGYCEWAINALIKHFESNYENEDLRERAIMYKRLIGLDRSMLTPFLQDNFIIDQCEEFDDSLLPLLGSIASIHHSHLPIKKMTELENDVAVESLQNGRRNSVESLPDLLNLCDFSNDSNEKGNNGITRNFSSSSSQATSPNMNGNIIDLLQ